jgi:ABC-type transport system involved in cytochrome bd biosynthesis fused ATPase/permease subunit
MVLVPIAAVIGSVVYLISNGYINANTAFIIFQIIALLFMLWSIGSAYESYRAMKRNQKELDERITQRAFERLGNGNT